mgnify:FL=1
MKTINENRVETLGTNRFDKPGAIVAAIVLGFAGTGVAMGLPLLVGSIATSLHFTDLQLGWLASSDMGGLFLGSVLTSFLVTRINRRYLGAFGLFLVILGNYASTQSPELIPLMLSRFCAGVGAGLCYATCTASLAGTYHAARTFSIFLFVLVAMNAFIFYIFPIIDGKWGVNGLFIFYLLEAIPILFILPLMPKYYDEETDKVVTINEDSGPDTHLHVPSFLPRLCLTAVFSFYILVGAYWAYVERAGVAVGISTDFISGILTWGQVFSLSGTALAAWLAKRYGQSKPLIFALCVMVGTMLVLAVSIDRTTLAFSIFSFSFFWIFIDVFQLGVLSNIDHSGHYAALVPASQGSAQAVAPTIAGMLLSYQLGYGAVMMLCAAAAAVALIIYLFVYRQLLILVPGIADSD